MAHADRRATPGAVITTQDDFGESYTFRADDDGVIHIRNDAQEAVADRLGLPVVRERKAEQGEKPAAKEG